MKSPSTATVCLPGSWPGHSLEPSLSRLYPNVVSLDICPASLELGDFCLSVPLQCFHYLVGNNSLLYHFRVSLFKVISLHIWYTRLGGSVDACEVYVKPYVGYHLLYLGSLF